MDKGGFDIIPARAGQTEAVAELYRRAFPEEDLVALVNTLFDRADVTTLVAMAGEFVAGHVACTRCALENAPSAVSLLGPLAVDARFRKAGAGSALVRGALQAAAAQGAAALLVLGDPRFYGRFGFQTERAIQSPFTLRPDYAPAWQSVRFAPEEIPAAARLIVPEPWQEPSLWA